MSFIHTILHIFLAHTVLELSYYVLSTKDFLLTGLIGGNASLTASHSTALHVPSAVCIGPAFGRAGVVHGIGYVRTPS